MLILYDTGHNKLCALINYSDLYVEQAISSNNSSGSIILDQLHFKYPLEDNNNTLINYECYIDTEDAEYTVKEINFQTADSGITWVEYICDFNIEPLKGTLIDNFAPGSQVAEDSGNLALSGTGWVVGYSDVTKKRTAVQKQCTVFEALEDIAKAYSCEITFDSIKKQVMIHQKQGADRGVYFAEQLNLKQLQVQGNSRDYITRLYPIGKDGLTIAGVNNDLKFVSNYQYSNKVISAYWIDNRYTNTQDLKDDAIERLDYLSKPTRAYSASIIDLARVSEKWDMLDFKLGDYITLISESTGIKEQQRIIKIDRYLDEPEKSTIEIANRLASLDDIILRVSDAADVIDNVTDSAGDIQGSNVSVTNPDGTFDPLNVALEKVGTLIAAKIDATEVDTNYVKTVNFTAYQATVTGKFSAYDGQFQTIQTNSETVNGTLSALETRTKSLESDKLSANDAKLEYATITSLDAVSEDVVNLKGQNATFINLLSDNAGIGTLSTTTAMANYAALLHGTIGDAQIEKLTAAKLYAGDLLTSKVRIISSNGNMVIQDNRFQIFATDANNKQFERIVIGDVNHDNTVMGMRIRGADGTTILYDENGATKEGFTSGYNRLIDKSLDPVKLDIEKVVTSVNGATTQINGSKIQLTDTDLITKLSTMNNTITSQGESINSQSASITANTNAISLKLDSQTFNNYKSSNDSALSTIDNTLNSHGSSITALQNNISNKVWNTDITTAVNEVNIGGTNLVKQSTLQYTTLPKSANFVLTSVNNVTSVQLTDDGLHYTATADNGAPNSSYGMKINSADFGLKVGDTIAFSSDIKGTFGTSNNGLCVMHSTTSDDAFYAVVSAGTSYPTSISDWTRKGRTYTIPDNIKIETNGSFYLYLFWGGGTGSAVDVYVRNVKVEKGNKPTNWSPAPEDVTTYTDTKVNNIQIGGRNLLQDSGFELGNSTIRKFTRIVGTFDSGNMNPHGGNACMYVSVTAGSSSSDSYDFLNVGIPVTAGQIYTISYWVACYSSATLQSSDYIYDQNSNVIGLLNEHNTLTADKVWRRIVCQFTPTNGVSALQLRFGIVVPANSTGWLAIDDIKVEVGNKPTDWTPAPEDVTTYTDLAKVNAINAAASDATAKANNAQTNAINAASTDATNKVNAVQIGIRNYLIHSDFEVDYGGFGIYDSGTNVGSTFVLSTDYAVSGRYSLKFIKAGTDLKTAGIVRGLPSSIVSALIGNPVTLSFKVKAIGTAIGKAVWANVYTDKGEFTGNPTILDGTWQTIYVTGTISASATIIDIYWLSDQLVSGNTIYTDNAKLELGNKATGWTSAPEDVTAYTDAAKVAAENYTDNKIETVNTTISTQQSEINQNKSDIALRVLTSDYTTDKTTINGQISSINTHLSTTDQSITTMQGQIDSKVTQSQVDNSIYASNQIPDTRNDNQLPEWYWEHYPRTRVIEFKSRTAINAPGSVLYGSLETISPWGDYSGGAIRQIFRSEDGVFERQSSGSGTSATWGSWIKDEDEPGVNSKITTYDTNTVQPINTRLSTAEQKITPTAIVSTVTSSNEYTGLITRVSNAESNITQNADNINLKVSKNGVIGSINISPETATIDISKVDMGSATLQWSQVSKSGATAADVGARANTWNPAYSDITGTKPPTNADNTSSVVGNKLTKIDSTGIYTGTITANQIDGGTINGITINEVSNGVTAISLHDYMAEFRDKNNIRVGYISSIDWWGTPTSGVAMVINGERADGNVGQLVLEAGTPLTAGETSAAAITINGYHGTDSGTIKLFCGDNSGIDEGTHYSTLDMDNAKMGFYSDVGISFASTTLHSFGEFQFTPEKGGTFVDPWANHLCCAKFSNNVAIGNYLHITNYHTAITFDPVCNNPDITIRPDVDSTCYVGDSAHRYIAMFAGAFLNSSQRELKENINPTNIDQAYAYLKNLKTYHYNLKKVNEPQMGVMADESPECILDNSKKSVNLYSYVTLVCNAVQVLQNKVESLEQEIIMLKAGK